MAIKRYNEMISAIRSSRENYLASRSAFSTTPFQYKPNGHRLARLAKNELSVILDYTCSLMGIRYKELNTLRGRKRGKVALVLGNGPSSAMIDWERFVDRHRDIEVVAINFFMLPEVAYHCIRAVAFSDPMTFDTLDKARPELKAPRLKLISRLKRLSNSLIFVPRHILKQENCLPDLDKSNRIITFSDSESRLIGGTSPLLPRSYVSMTLLKTLTILGFLGYEKILMIGADNNYASTLRVMPDNTCANVEQHAFTDDTLLPQNHISALENYKSLVSLEASWHQLSSLPVYNLDPLSFVTAFPKLTSDSEYFDLIKEPYRRKILELEALLR